MTRPVVTVVRTGVANIASVVAALGRLGAQSILSEAPRDVESADLLVLPGVGSFAGAIDRLDAAGLVDPLRARIEADQPTLAICLGMQILCARSEESPRAPGLGVIDLPVTRFTGDSIRIPQLGWNDVEPEAGCHTLTPGAAFFANSYRLAQAPPGWACAWTEYGGRFVSAIERGRILACQFHPELSGPWGLELIERWLKLSREEVLA